MFTIKHITGTGAESLYEAAEVSFTPTFSDQVARGGNDTVWYTDPVTREIKPISDGVVYVTNDAGATVAKYDMNPALGLQAANVGHRAA